MSSSLSAALSIIGVVIALGAGASYIWSIIRGPTRPHRVTWGVWTLAGVLGLWASLDSGAGIGLLVSAAFVAIAAATFALSLVPGYGKPGGRKSDYVVGVLAAGGIVAWQVLDFSTNVAATIAVVSDAAVLWFTLREAWLHPELEALWPWVAGTVAEVFGLLALKNYSYASAAYPVYIFVGNLLIVGALLFTSHHKKTKKRRSAT